MQIHELNTFSGTLGANDFFATDNGTDTSKVSAADMFAPLNTRIDNIIAGPASSAEEVIDARLGANGIAYPSLGDAVRSQVSNLSDALETIYAENEIVMSSGYIRNNSNPVDTTVVPGASWRHALIPCSAGDMFTLTARGGNAARAYAFIDSTNTILAFSGASFELDNVCIKAPKGAVYLIVNTDLGKPCYYGDTSETYKEWHNDLEIAGENKKVFRTGREQYQLGVNSIIRATSSRPQVKFFPVEKGKTYDIHFINGNIRRIGFFELSYGHSSTTHDYISLDNSIEKYRITVTSTYPIMGVYYSTHEATYGDCYIAEVSIIKQGIIDELRRSMAVNYDRSFANAPYPLMMKSYMGNNMNVHPSVKYFPNGLFGHKYWMAYTPYPLKSTFRENPCIAYSEDGFEWTNIAVNPLDTPHESNSNYNSDTQLVYNSNTGLLEVWYRFADVVNHDEIIYRKTSNDGLTWSSREELFRSSGTGSIVKTLSPAVIYSSGYKIWVVDDKEKVVKYYESVSGTSWNHIRDISTSFTYNGNAYDLWHIDVEIVDGEYLMVSMARPHGTTDYNNAQLFVCTSSDNITYSAGQLIIEGRAGAWDNGIYRSCLTMVEGKYRVYYSALNGNVYGMGITEGDEIDKLIGCIY